MHINWRTAGITILGILIAVAADSAAEYYIATTPAGQGLLRDFLVQQTQKEAASLSGSLGTSSPQLYEQRVLLPIPESYATYDYFTAINNVVADIALINNANVQLAPVLEQLNIKTLSGNFNGFYDLMGQARALANHNQALASQFVSHINNLSAANAQTKDAVTRSDTQGLVTAGLAFGSALQAYAGEVQTILYGDTPTSAQLAEFQSQVTAATDASQKFSDALKPLLNHIIAEVQRISAAASSTPTTTPAQ